MAYGDHQFALMCFFYVCPQGSTATIWSWSSGCVRGDSWKTRQCIAALATPQVTAATREHICKLLAWDVSQLQVGTWDIVDSAGHFHPFGSLTESRAGQTMPLKGAFCYWKGDMEAHVYAHRLTRYYRCNQCCDFLLGVNCQTQSCHEHWTLDFERPLEAYNFNYSSC